MRFLRFARRRLVQVQHRLATRSGHRFNQTLGLLYEAKRRDFEPVLLFHREADAATRASLPGRAVLHDPVFDASLSFDERTADFVAMLREHVTPAVRRDDRVLVTVATQCEVRAFARWAGGLPKGKAPWVVVLLPADRWNRYGPVERARQVAEFDVAAAEIGALDPAVRRRLVLCGQTESLAAEVAGLLRAPVGRAPFLMDFHDLPPLPAPGPAPPALRLGVLGGLRPEKGSHLVPAIVEGCRRAGDFELVLHLSNELLSPAALEELVGYGRAPHVTVLPGGLGREEYVNAIRSCDVMLFPYEVVPYRQRDSGVCCEAIGNGIPVVVPRGTWMSDQIASGRAAGIVADAPTVPAFVEAILACRSDWADLRARALAVAPAWQASESVASFLDWTESQIAGRLSGG